MKPVANARSRTPATTSGACATVTTAVRAGMTRNASIGARSSVAAMVTSRPPTRAAGTGIPHCSIQAVPATHDSVSASTTG